jgi:hypothetical protein
MKFDVKPPAQLQEEAVERQTKYGPWPKGVYDFEIISATEGSSKAGNPMITTELRAYNSTGHFKDLKDYFVASTQEKIHALCKAIGIEKKYLSGEIEAHDLQGCAGKVRLGIEIYDANDGTRKQRNTISGYPDPDKAAPSGPGVLASASASRAARPPSDTANAHDQFEDSEIPF